MLSIMQYLNFEHLLDTQITVFGWLGYYFVVEPFVSYLTLFYLNRDEKIGFGQYIVSVIVWTFLLDFLAIAILLVYFVNNLPD
jgi:membrane associated rhomboid family serine protease